MKTSEAQSASDTQPFGATPASPVGVHIRFLRNVYWLVWFVIVPAALASILVWALTPPAAIDRVEGGNFFRELQGMVHDQPVPIGIVAFTLFGMAIWAVRHHLPFARLAYPPLRSDIPQEMRPTFEKARALLDEAESILARNAKSIAKDLRIEEREALDSDLSSLRIAMAKAPFDQDAFMTALVKADGEVDVRLSRWRKSEIREYIESILVAVCVAMALRTFVVEAFKIPSGSMIPTLQIGDHIFVNKFTYGPALPGTHARVWTHMPPKRGDVMVFAFPEHPEQDFIKRVIAIPGDTLEARGGHPWINGWEVPHCYVGVYSYNEFDQPNPSHEGDLFVEYLGDAAYLTLYDRASIGLNEFQGPFTVKPGEAWVMGDNRNNSHDSRVWWNGQGGGVPFENIKGRAMFVWMSVSNAGMDLSRIGVSVMGQPKLPAAMRDLEGAMNKCLREKPPLEKTTPPNRPSPT